MYFLLLILGNECFPGSWLPGKGVACLFDKVYTPFKMLIEHQGQKGATTWFRLIKDPRNGISHIIQGTGPSEET